MWPLFLCKSVSYYSDCGSKTLTACIACNKYPWFMFLRDYLFRVFRGYDPIKATRIIKGEVAYA